MIETALQEVANSTKRLTYQFYYLASGSQSPHLTDLVDGTRIRPVLLNTKLARDVGCNRCPISSDLAYSRGRVALVLTISLMANFGGGSSHQATLNPTLLERANGWQCVICH
jgi:hypothetical protein